MLVSALLSLKNWSPHTWGVNYDLDISYKNILEINSLIMENLERLRLLSHFSFDINDKVFYLLAPRKYPVSDPQVFIVVGEP